MGTIKLLISWSLASKPFAVCSSARTSIRAIRHSAPAPKQKESCAHTDAQHHERKKRQKKKKEKKKNPKGKRGNPTYVSDDVLPPDVSPIFIDYSAFRN